MLILDAYMASEEPDVEINMYTLMLWMISGGAAHTFDEYRKWLLEAGFQRVERSGEHWVTAIR